MTELTPAAPAEDPSDLRAASLRRGASSFLAAFGGLLLFATGMAADSTAAMAAGIVVGVSGSASVYVLSWALRVRRGCPAHGQRPSCDGAMSTPLASTVVG
jgi:hypothetical protein